MITANGRSMTATLADTEAARRFKTRLDNGSVTIRMSDYGGFEKVGDLPWSLPTSNRQTTTSAGDIMLYQGRSIVIFYGSNSWDATSDRPTATHKGAAIPPLPGNCSALFYVNRS